MKFICDRQAISNAVNTVLKAVSVHSTMPILEGIFIKAEPGKVTLTGNDLEIGINCVIEAEVVSTGSVVVNSKLFGEIIRKVSGDSVSIDVSNTNLTTIKCGNSKFNINGIDPSEYPELQYFNPDFPLH